MNFVSTKKEFITWHCICCVGDTHRSTPTVQKQLCVIDKIERRHYVTSPRNVLRLQSSDIPGKPIDEVEKLLADARVHATLPKGTDIYSILLLWSHTFRNNLSGFETTLIKQMQARL